MDDTTTHGSDIWSDMSAPKAWANIQKCRWRSAGLDVRGRRGDHFLLVASLRVWDFRVNALIPHRRGRNHALMLGWWCGPLLVIGSGWVLALRDGLLNRIVRATA